MTADDFDLVIIGSGGAAFAAAIRAAGLDARCAVIEREQVGGTCVNVGCVPSKTLLAAARRRHDTAVNPFLGVPTSSGEVDLSALIAQKDDLVTQLRQTKYIDLADAYGFEVLHASARFSDDRTLLLSDGRTLRASSYLVATGAEPIIPDLPGLADVPYLTSTTAMSLDRLPGRLAVIGGGFVGMEQGQLLAHLGAVVTIIGRLAPRGEPELARRMTDIFAAEGITVIADRAAAVEPGTRDGVVVTAGGKRIEVDAILVATGRSGRVDGLDVDRAGIAVDDRRFIKVDVAQRTTNPIVFAAGDVTGGPQYVYSAAQQGAVAAENALTGASTIVDYRGLPSVVFTSPSFASAGLTETDALAAGHRCDCRVVEMTDVPRAIVNRDTRGAIKIIIDADSRKVLGVHAIADGAGDHLLGDLGLFVAASGSEAEFGITLAAAAQGKGLAEEAARTLIDGLRAHTAVRRLVAITDTRNAPSARLLGRLGMELEAETAAEFNGEPCREWHYSLEI